MYRSLTIILYACVLIPAIIHLVRYRDVPSERWLSVILGVAGVLLVPYAAALLCEVMISVMDVAIYLMIILFGFGLLFRSIFR